MQSGSLIDGKYRLERELGAGGIGTVWSAWHERLERRVAIKFLHHALDDRVRRRFAIEARALGRLNHPNCVKMYEFGYEPQQRVLFLVMEHLVGRTLWELRGTRTPLADVVEIAKQVATALAYAHHQGVAHRDLKPENVMLVHGHDGAVTIKVLDFGLAVLADAPDARVTRTGEVFGTPAYMSPEQVRGTRDAGPLSDLYSLGVMLYEMIEDRLPFEGESAFDFFSGHINEPVPLMRRRDAPPELVEIVNRLLQKQPENRFPSALALWHALSALRLEPEDESARFVVTEADLEATLSQLPANAPTMNLPGVELFDANDTTLIAPVRAPERAPAPARMTAPLEPPRQKSSRAWYVAAGIVVVALIGGAAALLPTAEVPQAAPTTTAVRDAPPVSKPAAAPATPQTTPVMPEPAPAEPEEKAEPAPEPEPPKPEAPPPRRAQRERPRKQKAPRKEAPAVKHSFEAVDYETGASQ